VWVLVAGQAVTSSDATRHDGGRFSANAVIPSLASAV
jgi:hypothetical protein